MASGERRCKHCQKSIVWNYGWETPDGDSVCDESGTVLHMPAEPSPTQREPVTKCECGHIGSVHGFTGGCNAIPRCYCEKYEPTSAAQREETSNPKKQTNAGIIHVNLRTQYDNAVQIQMTTLTYEGWLEALLDTANIEIRSLDQERKRLGRAVHEKASRETQPEHLCCICDSPVATLFPDGNHYCSMDKPSWQELEIGIAAPGPSLPTEARVPESRADRLNRYMLNPHDHLLDKSPYGDLVMFTEAAAAIRVLEGKLTEAKAARASVQDGKGSK